MEISSSKKKTCRQCDCDFIPVRPLQAVCSQICASRLVRAQKKEELERDKARKAALKRIPDLIKDAQIAFNAFIRLRDQLRPCICCGQPLGESSVGGGYDAGHYRSTGSASHLRFNEDNCHAQRKVCNRYGAGRAVDYRIGLIARIGLERVEALEADNTPHKWTREELIEIKETYRRKLKELSC
jgi:hypothetical protein